MIDYDQMEKISDNVKDYVEANYQLEKFQSIGKIATIGADFVSGLFVAMISILSIFFVSFWIANCISDYLNWKDLGFAIVGAFYFILYLFFILFKKKLLFVPVRNKLIRKLTQKD